MTSSRSLLATIQAKAEEKKSASAPPEDAGAPQSETRARSGAGGVIDETAAARALRLAKFSRMRIELIQPDPDQPRKDGAAEAAAAGDWSADDPNPSEFAQLVQSIRSFGVLEPLIVTPTETGHYRLLSGERRLRASREAGLPEVPVLVVVNVPSSDVLFVQAVENLHRRQMSREQKAALYEAAIELSGGNASEAIRRLGVGRTQFYATLGKKETKDGEVVEIPRRDEKFRTTPKGVARQLERLKERATVLQEGDCLLLRDAAVAFIEALDERLSALGAGEPAPE